MAKRLTLQIDRPCFKDILNGVRDIEHRFIYPSNAKRYIIQNEDDIRCVEYDELYLINGRRKEAPRLSVSVKEAEFIVFADEDGSYLTEKDKNGEDFIICQVWYHLGKVLSTENVPDDFYYDDATKKERLRKYKEEAAEIEQNML